jgi:two-component system, NarL family, response regulator LiaR
VQFLLSLPGRSEASKEKEKRRTVHTRSSGWFAESAGRLSSRLNSGCKRPKKKYSTASLVRLALLQSLPPRTLHSAAANAVWELLESVFRNEAAEAKMALALQVVSSHHLGALDIEKALSVQEALAKRLLPHAASEAETLKRPNCPRLFLLDGCSLNLALGPLSGRLRANSPGSKFLALLPPDRSGESEMMLLFHWGIDGFVTLHKKWKTELPKATMALLRGRLWVPSEVLLAFVKQMKTLLDRQLLAGQSLTAREGQVLQLLFRHLTNKEIAVQLNIRERTAKFHVSNLLRKLGLENRRNLLVSPLVS